MLKTEINISSTALVVIDLQKGITSHPAVPHDANLVIKNSAALAKVFRVKNMPVFLVRVKPSADGKDSLHPITDEKMWRQTPQPDWAEIVPQMGPEPDDFIVTKRQWGAFYGTELDLELRRRGINTIILCGIATNIGVESTARFAYEFGYNQIFVEDAMSARSIEEHNFTVTKTFPRIGLVRKTNEILTALKH